MLQKSATWPNYFGSMVEMANQGLKLASVKSPKPMLCNHVDYLIQVNVMHGKFIRIYTIINTRPMGDDRSTIRRHLPG